MTEIGILKTIKESLKHSAYKIQEYNYPPGCENIREERLKEIAEARQYVSDKIKQVKK